VLRVKIGGEGLVRDKTMRTALGARADGSEKTLWLWREPDEGAKSWRHVINEWENRGVKDVLIALVDGLKGFPEAITAVFPQWCKREPSTGCATASVLSPGRTESSPRPYRRTSAGRST
jgi:putative transposase